MIARLSIGLLVCVVALSMGCQKRVDAARIEVQHADALWGGVGFCARTPEGLACWESRASSAGGGGPTIVTGLTGVKDVVLGIGDACALHDRGVSCFAPGAAASKLLSFEAPTQIVEIRGSTLICVVDAKGVTCGARMRELAPKRRPELGKPRRIFASAGYSVLCGVYDDGTRCFEVNGREEFSAGIHLRGVLDPKAVYVSTIGGHAYAIDGGKLLYGKFSGTLSVGNPFAGNGPLDTEVTIKPFTGASVDLRPYPGVGAASGMAMRSIFVVALDDRGLVEVDEHADSFDTKRWSTSAVPTALFGGQFDDFFTIENGQLRQYAMAAKGKRLGIEIRGVNAPVHVTPGADWACVLERGGGVACVPSPPK